ncbi:uncharacterized protein LOC120653319 [Panicum virgatum]|uniref:uncharacterized protein LOC120653319 n=1 Tax=Panicum virgatum TaxID=38727 RepID=UPI0019D57E44|nr:uncharacterized protein LOC120653319 [Panicum virgatum]
MGKLSLAPVATGTPDHGFCGCCGKVVWEDEPPKEWTIEWHVWKIRKKNPPRVIFFLLSLTVLPTQLWPASPPSCPLQELAPELSLALIHSHPQPAPSPSSPLSFFSQPTTTTIAARRSSSSPRCYKPSPAEPRYQRLRQGLLFSSPTSNPELPHPGSRSRSNFLHGRRVRSSNATVDYSLPAEIAGKADFPAAVSGNPPPPCRAPSSGPPPREQAPQKRCRNRGHGGHNGEFAADSNIFECANNSRTQSIPDHGFCGRCGKVVWEGEPPKEWTIEWVPSSPRQEQDE